jgi:TonB family protein
MQSPAKIPWRSRRAVSLSFAFHLSVLALIAFLETSSRVAPPIRTDHFDRIAQIEIAGGTHAIKDPLREALVSAHTRKPNADLEASRKTIVPVKQPSPKLAGGGTPRNPHTGDGSNNALKGNGSDAHDVRPAFPVFSPRPPVTDRALLPSSEQKIVVDVDVDALGTVVSENLVKGMGNQLDKIVLQIVMTWRFQPATVDGKPVPTQAELIFPFNPSYPISDS